MTASGRGTTTANGTATTIGNTAANATAAGQVTPAGRVTAAAQVTAGRVTAHGRARLEVDWTRCDGHGVCAALLPAVITLDEWGYPLIDAAAAVTTGPGALKRVVTACPALALRRAEGPNDPSRR